MYFLRLQKEREKYDIAGFGYICQVCGYRINARPPEWCPDCGNHRILFKKTPVA